MTNPIWLRRQHVAPFVADDMVAVAVSHMDHWHAGLLYADSKGVAHLLHLAFHHRLINDQDFDTYAFVVPPLDPEARANVSAMCERIWRRNRTRGLPYGFRFDATRFDGSGEMRLGSDEVGLTCATLPLAVFASVGRPLVDMRTWEGRADDREAQAALLELLRRHCRDAGDHLATVANQVGCVRVRPQEAAGACSTERLPCVFSVACAAGEAIRVALGG